MASGEGRPEESGVVDAIAEVPAAAQPANVRTVQKPSAAMPPAARLTDLHICPMQTPAVPPIPHVGGPVVGPGCPTVLIGGLPAAVMGDHDSACVFKAYAKS